MEELIDWKGALRAHQKLHGGKPQNLYLVSRSVSDEQLLQTKLLGVKEFNPFLVTPKARPPPAVSFQRKGLQHIALEPYALEAFSREHLHGPTLFEFGPTLFNAFVRRPDSLCQLLVLSVRFVDGTETDGAGSIGTLGDLFEDFALLFQSEPFRAKKEIYQIYVFRKKLRKLEDIEHLFQH